MKLGCIGDDFTGSSDLANTLAKGGMRTVQYTGVPSVPADPSVEAGVVALKSRSNNSSEAVIQSLAALEWLRAQGCTQYFFKYCSTFDSTAQGNIGPVIDALAEALNAHRVIVCPAFPTTGRSIYQGHLFVNDTLLSESGMQNHPLTPMTDPDIRRWLSPQTKYSVGHIPAADVFAGATAVRTRLDTVHAEGHRHIVVDAIRDTDLLEIGKAAADLPLITGGSGVALRLPANHGCARNQTRWRGQAGKIVALAGSCSNATRAQIALHSQNNPSFEITAADVLNGNLTPQHVANFLMAGDGIPIAYSSADPGSVKAVQVEFGAKTSARAIEKLFAEIARLVVSKGVSKILTAGGETSGAVVEGLELRALEIGPEIDPGIPALRASDTLTIALKSGNFGSPDYFAKAANVLSSQL